MELYMRRRGILKPPPRSAFHLQFFIDPLQEPASWCDCPRSAHKQETCALMLNFGEGFFFSMLRGAHEHPLPRRILQHNLLHILIPAGSLI